jgi:hypothetical protein
MTIALTCTCAARLEIDEKFAGQTITCPDCQTLLTVPLPHAQRVRTSGLAIASLVLALVGAFTVVGTLLAAMLGLAALLQIRRHPEQLAGKSYAATGIILGLAFTALSVAAYSSAEIFGLSGTLRETQWLGRLDYTGELEIQQPSNGFVIRRPSKQWGIYKEARDGWGGPQPFLLVQPKQDAYILCLAEPAFFGSTLLQCKEQAIQAFRRFKISPFSLGRGGANDAALDVKSTKDLADRDDMKRLELLVDKKSGREERRYIVRLVKKENDTYVYIVAGGAAKNHFAEHEEELRQALDSFRLIPRVGGFNNPLQGGW